MSALSKIDVFFLFVVFMCFYNCAVSQNANYSNVEHEKMRHFSEIHREENRENSMENLNRQKRQLLFPIATLLQVSFCMATPVQLTKYNIYLNQGFQLNFMEPYLRSQLPNSFLGNPPVIDSARLMAKRDVADDINDRKIEDEVFTSENMYYFMGKALESYGYNGTACVLHSICQIAKVPFHKDEDLYHEIVHFVMTPSEHETNATSKNSNHSRKYLDITVFFEDYLEAENFGKFGGDCDNIYKHCSKSPLDDFTDISYEDDEDNDI